MAAQHCLTMAGDQQTERPWLTLHIFNIFFLVDPRQNFQTIVFAYLQHELHHFGVMYCTSDATLSVGMKNDISTGYSVFNPYIARDTGRL